MYFFVKDNNNIMSVDSKSTKTLHKFAEFLDEKNLKEHYTNLIRERVKEDLINHPLRGRQFASIREIRTLGGKGKDWFENLVIAVVNASRTADLEFSKEFSGDLFMEDMGDADKEINTRVEFYPTPTLPGAEFRSEISFESDDDNLTELLNIRNLGGEWTAEGKDGEKKSYAINSKRGLDVTARIERYISDAMSEYFYSAPIDEEIENKFEEWYKNKKASSIEKGKD